MRRFASIQGSDQEESTLENFQIHSAFRRKARPFHDTSRLFQTKTHAQGTDRKDQSSLGPLRLQWGHAVASNGSTVRRTEGSHRLCYHLLGEAALVVARRT